MDHMIKTRFKHAVTYVSVLVLSGTLCVLVLNIITLSSASNKKGVGISWNPQYHCTDEATLNNVHWW